MEHKYKEDLRVVDFPVAEPSPVTKNLMAAKKLLEQGWCQEDYKYKGSYCIQGAVIYANPPLDYDRNLSYEVIKSVIEPAFAVRRGISAWNDKVGRTKEEVLCLMDRAIAISIIAR